MSLEDINIFGGSSSSSSSSSSSTSYERNIKQKLELLKTDPRFSNVDPPLLNKIVDDAKKTIKELQKKKEKAMLESSLAYLIPFFGPFIAHASRDEEAWDNARSNKNELYTKTVKLLEKINPLSYEEQYKEVGLPAPVNVTLPATTSSSSTLGNSNVSSTTTTTIPNTTTTRGYTSMNSMVQDNLDEYSRRPERSRRKSLQKPMPTRKEPVDREMILELIAQGVNPNLFSDFDFTTGLEFEDEDQ